MCMVVDRWNIKSLCLSIYHVIHKRTHTYNTFHIFKYDIWYLSMTFVQFAVVVSTSLTSHMHIIDERSNLYTSVIPNDLVVTLSVKTCSLSSTMTDEITGDKYSMDRRCLFGVMHGDGWYLRVVIWFVIFLLSMAWLVSVLFCSSVHGAGYWRRDKNQTKILHLIYFRNYPCNEN